MGKPIQGDSLSNLGFCRRFAQSVGLASLLGLAWNRLGISNCSLPGRGAWSWSSKASSNNEILPSNMDSLKKTSKEIIPHCCFFFFLPLVLRLQVRDHVEKLAPQMKSENDSTLQYFPLNQEVTHPKCVFLWFVGHSDGRCGACVRLWKKWYKRKESS